jgi:hypothetical protein
MRLCSGRHARPLLTLWCGGPDPGGALLLALGRPWNLDGPDAINEHAHVTEPVNPWRWWLWCVLAGCLAAACASARGWWILGRCVSGGLESVPKPQHHVDGHVFGVESRGAFHCHHCRFSPFLLRGAFHPVVAIALPFRVPARRIRQAPNHASAGNPSGNAGHEDHALDARPGAALLLLLEQNHQGGGQTAAVIGWAIVEGPDITVVTLCVLECLLPLHLPWDQADLHPRSKGAGIYHLDTLPVWLRGRGAELGWG